MTILNKFKTIVIIGTFLIIGFSCSQDEFLETVNKTNLTDATMWASEGNADIFLNDCYRDLVEKGNVPDNLDNFTDDNDAGFYWASWNWKKGIVDATTTYYGVWGSQGGPANDANWPETYAKVRKLNTFIKKINENASNFSPEYVAKRIDEAKFLRAYFYSELFMRVGGMSIITEPQDRATMNEEQLYVPRSSFEETFNFIVKELGDVVNNGKLAVKYNKGDANAGRATLGAALALKGWIELFAASPAYNSSSPAVPASPDNLQSFATPNQNRWAAAAATNKKFIETYGHKGSGAYKLYPNQAELWWEANEYNSEVIWDRQQVGTTMPNSYNTFGGPVWVLGQYMCWGNYNPTQQVVDQFQMANGKPITDPDSGYDPQNPYVGREKRFYDFIVYDGAPYKQNWMPKTDTIYTRIDLVNPSKNQIDFAFDDVSNTGYYYKKRLDNQYQAGGGPCGMNHIYYRYAEVLLNYAEAQNEAVGPDASVYEAINTIRSRPSTQLPDLAPGLTKEEMRTIIRRERRVELVYEHKRLYDLWRWKDAMQYMNQDLFGMVIRNSSPNDNSGKWVYTPTSLNHPHIFTQRMYFNPIPQPAIDQNPKLKQNWGY